MSIDKPKSNSVITTELIKGDGITKPVIVFKVKDAGETRLELAKCHLAILDRACIHGLVQKVSDAAALSRDTKTGKSATPGDKLAAMMKVVEHLTSGSEEWNMKREGGGGPGLETQLLVKALCEVYPGKGEDQIKGWVGKRSAAERMALMQQDNIKAIMERLRGEATQSVDAGELLKGLDEMEEPGSENGA